MADKTYVVDAAGNVRTVSNPEEQKRLAGEGREHVSQAQAQQEYQLETDKESVNERYGTAGQAAMGLGSGLTLGLGPAAAAALVGGSDGEGIKRDLRAMQGSGGFMAGEAAGMLLPALLSGGGATGVRAGVGKALAATPAGMLTGVGDMTERLALSLLPETTGVMGKAGSSVLGMAARGASEGALMNLAHHAGQNIIYNKPLTAEALAAAGEGALFGGLLGGGLGAAGAGLGAVGEAIGTKGLGIAARRGEGAVAKELGITSEKEMMEFTGGKGFRERLRELEELKTSGGETVGSVIGKGPKEVNRVLREQATEAESIQSNIASSLDREAPLAYPSQGRIAGRIESEVLEPLRSTYRGGIAESVTDKVNENLSRAYASRDGKVWSNLVESRSQLAASIGDVGKGLEGMDPQFIKGLKDKVLNIVDDEMSSSMQAAAKVMGRDGLSEQFNAAVIAERTSKQLEQLTASKMAQQTLGANPLFNGLDMAQFGGAAMWNPVWATGMLAAKGATRMMEARIAPKLAEMAYQMSVGTKAASATVGIKGRIRGALTSFFKGTKGAANYSNAKGYDRSTKSREDYEKHLERAHELASPLHQQRVQAYARQLEAAGQMELASETLLMNQRAVQYILNNLPASVKSKGAGKLGPMPKYKGMDLKDFKFLRQFSALDQPMETIDRIAQGDISRDEVKAIKYVYPELHAELVTQASDAIMEMKSAGEFLPADKIATLGVVLDAPVDSTLTSEFIAGVQATFLPSAPAPAPAPTDQSVMVSGADFQTTAQKVMS